MNTTKVWHVALALGLAALAVAMTAVYVTSYKRHVQQGESLVTVLVAAKDIPANTAGSSIVSEHLLKPESVQRHAVVPGAISSPSQIKNLMLTQPIFQDEQVTTRRFSAKVERGIRASLQGTQRAFQLAGDANQLMAGTLQTGDHVDVVASWNYPESGQTHVSRVVLRDLLVLDAPAAPNNATALAATTKSLFVQLRVTDDQSQKLEWLAANAQWHLELRPPLHAGDSAGSVATSGTLASDGIGRSALAGQLANS